MALTLSTYAAPLLAEDDDSSTGTSPEIAAVNDNGSTGTSRPEIAAVNNAPASQPAQPTQPVTTNVNEKVAEAKGQIVAIHNNLIIINVSKVAHFQLNGNIMQADIQNAQFKYGKRANLRTNVAVEVKGRWDGSRFFASHVDFEETGNSNRPSTSEVEENKGRLDNKRPYAGEVELQPKDRFNEDSAEVKGKVLVIQQNLVILTADKTEGFKPGINMVAADIQNTHFKHGYSTDLRLNAIVEIKGHWDGNRLYAHEVKFED